MSQLYTPFRYDFVGSFLRPEYLKKARADYEAGTINAEELKKTGAQVDDVPTYETGYVSSPLINEKKEFEEGTIDLAVFTSASTVKGVVESTKGLDYSRVRAACIGKQTRAAADSYGMQTYMSEKATIDSLIELVETLKRSEEKWN